MLMVSGFFVRRGCFLPGSAGRGLPGGNLLFFCFAKSKVSKRKGDPAVCVPALRCGQPAVLGPAGVKNNSPAAQTSFCPDPSGPALLGAYRRGWGRNTKYLKKQGHATACPCWYWSLYSDFPVQAGPSSADGGGRSGRSCLSRRRVLRTAAGVEQRRLPRSAAQGTQTAGRLFFGDFLLAKQKKVTCCRATPGQQFLSKSATLEQNPACSTDSQQEQKC